MEQLLQELELPLYRFLLRLCGDPDVASDLVQDSLLRAWKNRRRLRERGAARVWVFRIAVNVWKDHRNQACDQVVDSVWLQAVDQQAPPDDVAAAKELGEQIWLAIDQLPKRQREVLHLRVIEQMKPVEIAEILALSPQLVRSNLAAARKRIRSQFADQLPQSQSQSEAPS